MTIKEQMENGLKDAMRAQNSIGKNTLRVALSAIKLTEIDKGVKLDDAGVIAILQKEIKNRTEAILEAEKINRTDLIDTNKAEIKVLESYLPAQMSPEELETLVKAAVAETGAGGIKDMGKVMKALLPKVQGRAAGDQVSQMVKKLLQP
jgi:uncharacterized protein YqeY